jgi:hypothetical protein
VRRMVFGPHEDYMTTWNAMICAFQLQEQVPSFAAPDGVISARAGRPVWVFGLADRPPTVLLTYRTNDVEEQFAGSPIQRLRTIFSGMDDPAAALAAWESRLRPFVWKHQRIARLKQQMFVPSSRPVEALRSVVLRRACRGRDRRLSKARAGTA